MDEYLKNVNTVSGSFDAKELAASVFLYLKCDEYTQSFSMVNLMEDRMVEGMKWGLSVKPSSIPNAGNVPHAYRVVIRRECFSRDTFVLAPSWSLSPFLLTCRPFSPALSIYANTSLMSLLASAFISSHNTSSPSPK